MWQKLFRVPSEKKKKKLSRRYKEATTLGMTAAVKRKKQNVQNGKLLISC